MKKTGISSQNTVESLRVDRMLALTLFVCVILVAVTAALGGSS